MALQVKNVKLANLQVNKGNWAINVHFEVEGHQATYRAIFLILDFEDDYRFEGFDFASPKEYETDDEAKKQLNEMMQDYERLIPELMNNKDIQLEKILPYLTRREEKQKLKYLKQFISKRIDKIKKDEALTKAFKETILTPYEDVYYKVDEIIEFGLPKEQG